MEANGERFAERLGVVRQRIERAGGDLSTIGILVVTKGFGADCVETSMAAGLDDVGENYAQELLAKAEALPGLRPRWHFIGRLQRNKVRKLAPWVHLWQSVDRIATRPRRSLASAPGAAVLVQVDVSGEPQKGGCSPEDVPDLVDGTRRSRSRRAGPDDGRSSGWS